ncbi:AAA family ATPase [Clostridium perfringens]|uniref:AAA family ATPase n=1 Tax=Clostridium perfringens TaxID=1502 RepID=UPI00290B0622|nr:AAA family ATPase [Clostridium perfringens]MDU3844097.1 AAA family ATPase [Clostridium perfringens]
MKGLIVFGEKGSGKDTVAKLINEYSEKSVSFFNIGDLVRDMSCIFLATDKWENKKREFYVDTAIKLKEIDKDFLSYYVLGKILDKFKKKSMKDIDNEQLIIVTGGRTYEDFEFWKNSGFKTLGVKCDEKVRIERLKSRDGYEQNSQDDLEKNTRKIIDLCDFTVDNSGSFKDLTKEVTDFVVENGL